MIFLKLSSSASLNLLRTILGTTSNLLNMYWEDNLQI